jgi:exonuclease SbcD
LHVGGAQALFTRNIPIQIQYAALGHLHRYHAVSVDPCPVVYSSSPLSYSFSEAEQEKQVVIIDLAPDEAARYRPIKLNKGRPLFRMSFDNLAATLLWLKSTPYCFVEITYETDTSIDHATRRAIMKAHDGIVYLIPKIRNPIDKDDSLMTAEDMKKDIGTLFKLYYESVNGFVPDTALIEVFKEVVGQNELP